MTDQRYDAIIVGSGAGGAATAFNLVRAGKRTLVLERGDRLPRDGSTLEVKQVFKVGRFKNHDPWVDSHNRVFIPDEHYNVGGKTKWYGAALLRFSPDNKQVVGFLHVQGAPQEITGVTCSDGSTYRGSIVILAAGAMTSPRLPGPSLEIGGSGRYPPARPTINSPAMAQRQAEAGRLHAERISRALHGFGNFLDRRLASRMRLQLPHICL